MTREQYMRRKRLRLARNWALLILICAAIVALMTRGILGCCPKQTLCLPGPGALKLPATAAPATPLTPTMRGLYW